MTVRNKFSFSPRLRVSIGFLISAILCLFVADISITSYNPWLEMGRFVGGMLAPDLMILSVVGKALITTLAFAFLGVALAAVGGFLLALIYHHRWVRGLTAFLRAVHELFWALIFLQFFGLHPLTGLLAIAIPYSGVFAKIYAEILDETSTIPQRTLPNGSGRLVALLYTRIPQAWPHLVSYTRYRLECGIRTSAILGFVGMPTLGYYLESSFAQGLYSEVATLLLLFYLLIGTMRFWLKGWLIPPMILIAPFMLDKGLPIIWSNVGRFFSEDIVPAPLRRADSLWSSDTWLEFVYWLQDILSTQALPGLWNTLVLSQIALVLTAILTLLLFPLVSRKLVSAKGRFAGHLLLIVARSTPEYLLAYILLQLWGPSMLPAIVALAIHNGSLIGFLIGQRSNELKLRQDTAVGVNRYSYEILPRIYSSFLAFLFYRWEVIIRETAILGILGIHTLGFFVDSAIQDIRFDVAILLILISALVNIGVDTFARRLRSRLRLTHHSAC
ncbi:PhnE/PtxC family ABC transporter permease [Amphritea balenae]|uniref:ABC transporter permease n=1 Tax=Amphritea balenae TaxID=452629 RepID=A0A3P1SQW6_9GAMM|nr:ABC transporter permease [Amphritea balenae]RRC99566.1 ABC transporter permease [Amphritea balenae]GGK78090.1 hypothetical protein GCM10007941_30240 [Amphritea balenae]